MKLRKKKKEDLKNYYLTAAHRQYKVELEDTLIQNNEFFILKSAKCFPVNSKLTPIYPNLFKNLNNN